MNESQPDNRPSPYRRGPTPWIVWVGAITFFVGLNLMSFYFTLDHLDGHRSAYAGFPQPFVWYGGNPPTVRFDLPMFFVDLGIAVAGTLFFVRGLRDGIRGFWQWIRTAGVQYASEEEENA
jgi:hypothetical protein